MKYLVSNDKLIIDIAKQNEIYKRRIAIDVLQSKNGGIHAQLQLYPIANENDIDFLNSQGANYQYSDIILLNGGQIIPTFIPLTKTFSYSEVDALDSMVTYPNDVTTRTEKDRYFELISASKVIEQDGLFGGLLASDFEIIEIS